MLRDIEKQHNIPPTQYTGKGVKIIMLDASFNNKHPAFKHALSEPHLWYDGFNDCRGDNEILLNRTSLFYNTLADHGNHTAGLAVGIHHETGQKLGLATGATLITVCAMNSTVMGENKELQAAYLRSLNYLKQIDGPCVINLSQELYITEEVLLILIELVEQGKLIMKSAGNKGHCLNNPKAISASIFQNPILRKGLLVVGSLSEYDSRAMDPYKECDSSGYVDFPFKGNIIWVRGKERYSASGSDYNVQSGTSMASPTAAGAAACLWEQNPTLTNEQIIKIMVESGTPIHQYGNKLNVENMLQPDIQKNIINTPVSLDLRLLTKISQKTFPDVNIILSQLDNISFANPSAEVTFRKLTEDEIKQYAIDIQQLLSANEALISESTSTAFYGIIYKDTVRSCLMMPCLTMILEDTPIFVTDGFVWRVNKPHHILNELGLQLSTHPAFENYKTIYTNWEAGYGLFQKVEFRSQTFKNLKELESIAAMILQLKPKKEDFLPNISIPAKSIEISNNHQWQLSKMNPEAYCEELICSVKEGFTGNSFLKQGRQFCISSHCHLYTFKFNDRAMHIQAYLSEYNKIILQIDSEYGDDWFVLSQALLKFTEEAKKQGYDKVIYAASDIAFSLPFRRLDKTPNITDEMKSTISSGKLKYLCYYDLSAWDFTIEVGEYQNKSPALITLARFNDHKGVEYYLTNKADVNGLNRQKQNALHEAAYNKNSIIVRLLCDAGIDQSQRNFLGLTPLDIAKEQGTIEIIEYLSSSSSFVYKNI